MPVTSQALQLSHERNDWKHEFTDDFRRPLGMVQTWSGTVVQFIPDTNSGNPKS